MFKFSFRGMGMIVGIEIVVDKESRKPAPEAADLLAFKYDISVVFISSPIKTRNLYLSLLISWLLSMILV